VSHQLEEVLRLANELVLLEAGRVLAQGPVSELSLRQELHGMLPTERVGAVLEGVIERHTADGVELRVGAGTLQVSVEEASVPGTRLRLQVLARDVIIATQSVQGLSVRNVLRGAVTRLRTDGDGVLVEVDVGDGARVLSRITTQACAALALRPGMEVWALFKAVSTRGHAYHLGATLSPEPPAH